MTEADRYYLSAGLRIASGPELPGLPSAEPGPVDLTLIGGDPVDVPTVPPEGEIILDFAHGGARRYSASRHSDGYTLRFSGVCDVRMTSDLSRAVCHPATGVDPGLVGVILSGTTLAFVLAMRGACVLHASGVEIHGRGIAFVGHSGMGKSTLAVAACAGGGRLIAEDVLVVEPGSPPTCIPGNRDVRLRSGALTLVDGLDGWARTTTADERLAVQPPVTDLERVPLELIVLPRPSRRAERLSVEVVDRANAVFRLINYPRVLGFDDPPLVKRQFEALARIAGEVPVVFAEVPWGPPFAPDLGEQLLGLLDRFGANAEVG